TVLRIDNAGPAADAVAERFAQLGAVRSLRTRRDQAEQARDALRNLAATESGAAQITGALRTLNAQPERLDALMQRQHWRLARW
ncbi:hypothetical protein ABTK67_19025, partial [Acinetobacter baumannii]